MCLPPPALPLTLINLCYPDVHPGALPINHYKYVGEILRWCMTFMQGCPAHFPRPPPTPHTPSPPHNYHGKMTRWYIYIFLTWSPGGVVVGGGAAAGALPLRYSEAHTSTSLESSMFPGTHSSSCWWHSRRCHWLRRRHHTRTRHDTSTTHSLAYGVPAGPGPVLATTTHHNSHSNIQHRKGNFLNITITFTSIAGEL